MLLIAQSAGQTGILQVHRPEFCYPAGGYSLSPIVQRRILENGQPIAVNQLTATLPGRTEQILYWTRVGDAMPVEPTDTATVHGAEEVLDVVLAALVMVTGYTSINAIIKAEMFPADIRALGVALPFAIANVIFGGTAEYVALYLKDIGHERWFYIYISALAACSLVAYIRMRETKTSSLILED